MKLNQRHSWSQHWNSAHATKQSLVELMELPVLNHEGPFICDFCGKIYLSRDPLRIHLKTFHTKAQVYCDLCPNSYHLKYNLRIHLQKTHLKNFYVCDVCGFNSFRKFPLKLHIKIHQPKVKCPICDKLVTDIKTHKLRVHPAKNKLYICDVCGFTAGYKSTLEQHKTIHEPKVKCPICHRLVIHIKSHNLKVHTVKNKLYVYGPKVKCPICYKFVVNFELHKSRVHATKNKLYVCDVCGYKSADKPYLKRHMKIHEPKVKCPICKKLVTNDNTHKRKVHPLKYAARR